LQTGLNILNKENGNAGAKIEIDGDFGVQTYACLENACKRYPLGIICNNIRRAAVSNAIFDTKNKKKVDTKRRIERAYNNLGYAEGDVLQGGVSYYEYVWRASGGACDLCADLDGQQFKDYDEIPDHPHPNCQCYVEMIKTEDNNGGKDKKDEPCDCLDDLFDEVDELIDNGENLMSEIADAVIEFANLLNKKYIEPVRDTIEECIDAFEQIMGTIEDFNQNYNDMKEANIIGADKYFHAKAQCNGAQRGELGFELSKGIGDLREWTDYYRNIYQKGMSEAESAKDCYEDEQANEFGRQQGRENPDIDCEILIDILRPRGLPDRY
jgi:hypothetical protein